MITWHSTRALTARKGIGWAGFSADTRLRDPGPSRSICKEWIGAGSRGSGNPEGDSAK